MRKHKHLELDLFDDEPLTAERLLWLSLSELREGHHKLRKRVFKEFSELKKENNKLKQKLWDLQKDLTQKDLFQDGLFAVAK